MRSDLNDQHSKSSAIPGELYRAVAKGATEAIRASNPGHLVIADGSVIIPWSRGGSLGDYLQSLERLLSLDPAVLYPAHGPEIRNPIAARVMRTNTRITPARIQIDKAPTRYG